MANARVSITRQRMESYTGDLRTAMQRALAQADHDRDLACSGRNSGTYLSPQPSQGFQGQSATDQNVSGEGASNPTSQQHVITERDLPALAAKQHPGEDWGYLSLRALDESAPEIVVKVPNTAANGALLKRPLSGYRQGPGSKDFYTQVKGYLRRGQGKNGTDIFEATAVLHIGDPTLGDPTLQAQWKRVAGRADAAAEFTWPCSD
jgi:hypothetical protein